MKVPLTRDVLLMFVPDEEIGGALGAEWMRKNHYAELDPEYVIDEGGFGSRDMFTAEQARVRHLGRGEEDDVAAAARRRGRRSRLAAARPEPERSPDARAVAAVRASPCRGRPFPVVETMKQRHRRTADGQQVQQRDPAVHDLADQPAFRRRRSAEGQRDSVGRRSDDRLPHPAGDDGGAVDQGDRAAGWRTRAIKVEVSTRETIRSCRRRTRRSIARSNPRSSGGIPRRSSRR